MGTHTEAMPSTTFAQTAVLSQRQRATLNALSAFPQGAQVSEIAASLGLHVNTVRGHLEELVTKNLLRTAPLPSKGRGRPVLMYHATSATPETVAQEYLSLISLLIQHIDLRQPDEIDEVAKVLGKQWAHSIFADHHLEELNGEQTLITLINYLRHLGFDPEVEKTQDPTTSMLQLRTCPFGSMAHAPLSFVCRAHEGMLSAVEKTGGISFELTPLSAPHQCSIVAQLHGNETIHRQRGEEHPHAGHR